MNGSMSAPHPGAVAASGIAVAKQLPLRNHPPLGLPTGLRPAGLTDLPRLFSKDDQSPADRVARLSAAALVYSVDKSTEAQAGRLLKGDESTVLEDIHKDRTKTAEGLKTDRSCPHCRLLLNGLYKRSENTPPPIVVVSHRARVNVAFNPDTNISEASVSNFQVLVPQEIAADLIEKAHPLHWASLPGTLFKHTEAVKADGTRLDSEQEWETQAMADKAFLFEDVALPVNDDLTSAVENILCIRHFKRPASLCPQDLRLEYEYSLERCVRSNFGVAWEPSGLDIDGGGYRGRAIPVTHLNPANIDFRDGNEDLAQIPLGHLRRRDIAELRAQYDASALTKLYEGLDRPDILDLNDQEIALDTVKDVGERLSTQYGKPYSLVTISASKRLHFTIPENGPIELWQILTWTAPAFLFTFLNLAVCLAPHLLLTAKAAVPTRNRERVVYA